MRQVAWVAFAVISFAGIVRAAENTVAQVNFQPAGADLPAGHQPDAGATYSGSRGYGWSRALPTKERGTELEQRRDTYVYVKNSTDPADWEYDLADGDYEVTVVLGSPRYDGVHYLDIEGVNVVNGTATERAEFIEVVRSVTITDGKLNLAIGGPSGNAEKTKICYLVICTASASNSPPTASASGDVTAGDAPLTVTFTGAATDDGTVTGYAWEFGDGETSTEQNPVHTYVDPGTYNGRLVVTDDGGLTGEDTFTVVVTAPPQPPTASATLSVTSGEAPLVVDFTGSGTDGDGSIAGYLWEFGDGATSTAQSPQHTYADPGTYDGRLVVTDNDGLTGEAAFTVVVTAPPQPPTASAALSVTSGAPPLVVDFTGGGTDGDGSIAGYLWEFGDGTSSTAQSPQHTYTDTGTYNGRLVVTDDDGLTGEAAFTVTVSLTPPPPPPPPPPPSVTYRVNFQPSDADVPADHQMDSGAEYDGPRGYGWSKALPTKERGTELEPRRDTYVYVKNSTAPADWEYDLPDGDYDVTVVLGSPRYDGVHYLDVEGVNAVNGTATDRAEFIEVVRSVTVTDGKLNLAIGGPGGGSDKTKICYVVMRFVPPVPPTASAAANVTVGDAPLTVSFTGTATDDDGTVTGYLWEFGDGGSSTEQSPVHTYVDPGTYNGRLVVTDDDGLTAVDTFTIVVNDPLVPPTASATLSVTSGDAPLVVDFIGVGADGDGSIAGYLWEFGDGVTSTSQSPQHTYADPGTYTGRLVVTDDDDLTGEDTFTIVVTAPPVPPTASATLSVTSGAMPLAVDFTGVGADEDGVVAGYLWEFGDDTTSTEQSPQHTFTGPGIFQGRLVVTDDDGLTAEAAFTVTVSVPPPPAGSVLINFQPEESEIPGHYLDDNGLVYDALRGHGWSRTIDTARRYRIPDHRKDAFAYVRNSETPAHWTCDVPAGTYVVTIVLGSPRYPAIHYFDLEGVTLVREASTEEGEFIELVEAVVIADGQLNLSIGGPEDGSSYTRLCYIDIVPRDPALPPPLPLNAVPLATASADVTTGETPLTVSFTGQGEDDGAVTYLWDFGDGTTSTEQNPVHTYVLPAATSSFVASRADFVAVLTVTDEFGRSHFDTVAIAVTSPAAPGTIVPPAAGALVLVTERLGVGTEGVAYESSLVATGGTPPYTFRVTAGSFPLGLDLDLDTGAITGAPTAAADYSFTITVDDSAVPPVSVTRVFQLPVLLPGLQSFLFPTEPAADSASSLGLEPGIWAIFLRGGHVTRDPLDWSRVDFAIAFDVTGAGGALSSDGLGIDALTQQRLPDRTALWRTDRAMDAHAWLWVETAGDVEFKIDNDDGTTDLYLHGQKVLTVTDDSGTALVPGLARGLHRLRLVHRGETTGSSFDFDLQMKEAGATVFATIPADRVYCGPAIDELPLIVRTAVEGFPFSYRLRTRASDGGGTFTRVHGQLPGGLSLEADGTIHGTPLAAGTHTFTVQLVSPSGLSTVRRLALHVLPKPPVVTRNDAAEFALTFDGGMDQANGLTYANLYTGDGNLGLGNLRFFLVYNAGDPTRIDPVPGALGSGGAVGFNADEFGFYISGSQYEHLSDYYPALRTSNRLSYMFRMPDAATPIEDGVTTSISADGAQQYLIHALSSLHMAGHNTTRFQGHDKEERNFHFYHYSKEYWTDEWRTRNTRYLGDRWFYVEYGDQVDTQRAGSPSLAGSYNPIESYGNREYHETLSRFYTKVVSNGLPANLYADPNYAVDNVRAWREEPRVLITSLNGKRTARVTVSQWADQIEIPFKVSSTALKPMVFRIQGDPDRSPDFGGDGWYVDENANGLIDADEPSLDGQRLTPVFSPGQTRHFVRRLDISGQAVDTEARYGATLRAKDPANVITQDGDTMLIIVFKASAPGLAVDANLFINVGAPGPYDPANASPAALITTAPITGLVGQDLTFSGTVSDVDGPKTPIPYWDFGDDSPYGFGGTVVHRFAAPGVYTVRLYATDSLARAATEVTVTITSE